MVYWYRGGAMENSWIKYKTIGEEEEKIAGNLNEWLPQE